MPADQSETHYVFPLNTVLFPGGIIPLQIFEQRYLNLVTTCLKDNHGFVIALIKSGSEVNDKPAIHMTGTYAEIINWDQLDNTLLGITVRGSHKVSIKDAAYSDIGLLLATTENINFTTTQNIPPDFYHLKDTLHELAQHPFVIDKYGKINYTSAPEVCDRLSELLPVDNSIKQELLEMRDIKNQITRLNSIIKTLSS